MENKRDLIETDSPEQSLFQRPENGRPSFRVSKGRGYSPSQDNTHLGLDFSLLSETLSKKITNSFSPMGKRPPVAAAQGRDPTVERAEVAMGGGRVLIAGGPSARWRRRHTRRSGCCCPGWSWSGGWPRCSGAGSGWCTWRGTSRTGSAVV